MKINRPIRPLKWNVDHWHFDSASGEEFLVWGEQSRLDLAMRLATQVEGLMDEGKKVFLDFLKPAGLTKLMGEFTVESVSVHAERTEKCADFVLHCTFFPHGEKEKFECVDLNFDFDFIVCPHSTKMAASESFRCIRFAVGV